MRTTDFGNKPFDTKIQITKSGDFFETYIPPLGSNPVILSASIFSAILSGFSMWIWNASQATALISISSWFLLPNFFVIGLFTYIWILILFVKTYLRIDRHEISLTKTLFGQKISRQPPVPKREITKIIFTHEHTVYFGTGFGVGQRQIPAELKLQVGTISISVGGNKGDIKNEVEIEWLASEVSEWLDKPLTVVEHPAR
jgi:hypothetical protein